MRNLPVEAQIFLSVHALEDLLRYLKPGPAGERNIRRHSAAEGYYAPLRWLEPSSGSKKPITSWEFPKSQGHLIWTPKNRILHVKIPKSFGSYHLDLNNYQCDFEVKWRYLRIQQYSIWGYAIGNH